MTQETEEKRPLIKIIEEIADLTREINKNMEDIPYAVRQGRSVLKEQCRIRLGELQKEFEAVVMPDRLVGLFVEGAPEDVKRLADFIDSKGGIVIDANMLYSRITDIVEPSYYKHRTFDTTQFGLLVSELGNIGGDFGYSVMQHPAYKEATCPTKEDTLQHVKTLVRNAIGDDINLKMVRKEILDTVQRKKLRAEQLVVLVSGANPIEKQKISFYFNRTVQFNIPTNYQPTQKEVSNLLKNKEDKE